MNQKILVTGAAGFIGAAVVQRLFANNATVKVVGLDNINDYYDPQLKIDRLKECGIDLAEDRDQMPWYKYISSSRWEGYRFIRMNLEDTNAMAMLFANEDFDIVINLAAQAGVRYSIENPHAYIGSNIDGFINVLEGCRQNRVGHLVYA
ncbi:MAG: NAD-dependent epimerase/dehydratase family protein, partial [Muribaculaceae bacterium]|nr:NAD-dependent epimerase/dehydratase family protein [Muribaculaceae bacterium]